MRSLNLDQLRAFVEVVERGSFTAAARELNLTQPAVTHQVQELERRFKVALLERFGKRAHLTQAGEKLIEHARNLLEEDSRTQVMMRRFGDGWLGRVRVGTSMTVLMYLLPPILRQLKTDHPQLEINLKAGLTATTLQMLKTNALDIGLCAIPIEDPAFETVPLFKDELVAILPAMTGHVPKTVTPAFLSRCPLILGSEKSALRRTITDWLALVGPPPRPLMEFDNVEAIKSVVAVGLGASIVPSLSLGAGRIPAAHMLVRPLNPRASRPVGLVRLRGKRATEGMEFVSAALLSLRRIDPAGAWRISLNSGRRRGESLAISVPRTEAAVIRHFKELMSCRMLTQDSIRSARAAKSSLDFCLITFPQIRNCSGQIGIVDQLEAAFTAGLPGRGVRSVFGICGEGLDCFPRWKLQKRNGPLLMPRVGYAGVTGPSSEM